MFNIYLYYCTVHSSGILFALASCTIVCGLQGIMLTESVPSNSDQMIIRTLAYALLEKLRIWEISIS